MNYTIDWINWPDLTDNVPEDYETIKLICNIVHNIHISYLWILFAIGVPGNVLTIIATLTMQVMSPATFFVTLLAAFDGSALVVKLIYHQVFYHRVPINNLACKSEIIVAYLATVANWMLVLICAERFVSVCYPLKKISLITKRRSYICAGVVSLIILVLYLAISLPMRESVANYCTTNQYYMHFWNKYWYFINATFFLFLPLLLVLICTVGIVRGLRISCRDRRNLLQKGSERGGCGETVSRNNQRLVVESERVERAITIMVVLAAVLFIVMALPSCVFYLMPQSRMLMQCTKSTTTAHLTLFKEIQHVLVDATHAINFFIYFIAAKRFRDQLFKLLRCKVSRKEKFKNKYQNTYSTQLSTSSKINLSVIPQTPIK